MKYVPKELHGTADISKGRFVFREWMKTALGAVLALVLVYLGIGVATDVLVANISEETEARWFGWTTKDMDKDDGPQFHRAQRIFTHLIETSTLRPLPYYLFLMPMDFPNAVAVPGGGVGVTLSLLQDVKSDMGVATVLAHELGHHQFRHGLRQAGRALVWQVLLSAALGDTGLSGVELTLRAVQAGYSRDQERDADRFGLRLIHQVYGHTEGALEFFELIQKKYNQGDNRWTGLLSTHPLTEERIEYLQQIQEELREGR